MRQKHRGHKVQGIPGTQIEIISCQKCHRERHENWYLEVGCASWHILNKTRGYEGVNNSENKKATLILVSLISKGLIIQQNNWKKPSNLSIYYY